MSVSCFATETIKISSLTDGSSSVTTGTWLVGTIVDTTYKFSASSLVGLYLGTLTNDKYCKYNSATGKIDCIYAASGLGDNNTWTGVNTFTSNIVGALTGNVTGNADTATALAANPDPCAAGSYVSDIAADGELTCANPLDTPTFILADDGELPLPAALPEVDSFFKIASDGTMSFVAISDYSGIPSYGELTTEHVAVWYNDDGTWKLKAGDLPATDNSTASHWLYKDSDGHIENAVISTGLTDTSGTLTVTGMKSAGSTGQISITGPAAGQNRVKTVRDANDTLVEAGGNNTLTGANTIGDGGDDQIIKLYKNATNAKWSGTVMDFTCHETIALGQPVVINGDGEVALANADTPATLLPAIGIAVVGGNAAATCTVLLHGSVTVTAWAWTPGAIIYVDDSAAGALTATVGDIGAGNGVQRIGVAIHADSILVMPSLTVTVLE